MIDCQKGPSMLQHYKKCLLCLYEKLEIVNYPHPEELFNKRSELVSNFLHANKYLFNNYKAKD